IGMGLNLDLDHVIFAALEKFDGREQRPLTPAELAQIAGRAGRYTRDGAFGSLAGKEGLSAHVARAIEEHRFAPDAKLVWRNSDLDLSSIDGLIASLRAPPPDARFRRVERADDFDALLALARSDAVRERAGGRVELLWEVCQIPDYRKLLLDTHPRLLAEIFEQLTGPAEALDVDWLAARLSGLDVVEGELDALMTRIAFTRTWTYVTSRSHWVPDAAHWQGVARDLEDRLSDALHERLTRRFVEARGHGRPAAPRRRSKAPADHPFAALQALDERLPEAPDESASEVVGEVDAIVDARHDDLTLEIDGTIRLGDRALARLHAGPHLLRPQLRLVRDLSLRPGSRARIERRLHAFVVDTVDELLAPLGTRGPLTDAAEGLSPACKGLLYQLEQGLGCAPRSQAAAQLRALTPADRAELSARGVELGGLFIYAPALARAGAIRRRFALALAHAGGPTIELPRAGAVSLRVHGDARIYALGGYPVFASRAIRVDQLERAHAALRELEDPREPPEEVRRWLGVRRAELGAIVRAMGLGSRRRRAAP
ncbi:MAG: helicase, partial [Myxococcales bacterium]|nr:helicase [Myxococcales bacterium]